MMIGELIQTSTTPVYSPPVPRGGDAGLFAIDALQVSTGSPSLAVDVEHKNYSDTSWTTAGAFAAITATGVTSKHISGLKEQVRLKFTMSGSGDWERIFVLEPSWED